MLRAQGGCALHVSRIQYIFIFKFFFQKIMDQEKI
jgi:hypothetical protein